MITTLIAFIVKFFLYTIIFSLSLFYLLNYFYNKIKIWLIIRKSNKYFKDKYKRKL